MGINQRNLDYIFPNNCRRKFASVDNKLTAKEILADAGIPVPETYAHIRYRSEIPKAFDLLSERKSFVIKPLRSMQGRGICVISDRKDDQFLTTRGRTLSAADVRMNIESILSGMHSYSGLPDQAFIEQYIVEHSAISMIHGTPAVSDIRLIIYKSKPIMAMLRIPCKASKGVSNLHAGGIGIGIDRKTGITSGGVQHDRPIERHPDTDQSLSGHEIPGWQDLIHKSTVINELFEMDYLGVDYVIDRDHGPLILEVNARPGLAIQLANKQGLLTAIHETVEGGAE